MIACRLRFRLSAAPHRLPIPRRLLIGSIFTLVIAVFAAMAPPASAAAPKAHRAKTNTHRAGKRVHTRAHGRAPRAHRARRHGRRGHHAENAAPIGPEPTSRPARAELTSLQMRPFRALPPLRGSRESLLRQNERDQQEGLRPIQDREALVALLETRQLVSLPSSPMLRIDPRLAQDERYCRPWTARFLSDLSRSFYARYGAALQVNSAVRTQEYQRHLLRVNANAAPAEGDTASPHLTGGAVDIGKKELTAAEIEWIRARLLPLQQAGEIDVEEEFYQACFHISVYTTYVPAGKIPPANPEATHSGPTRPPVATATGL